MKTVYLVWAILGTVIPVMFFLGVFHDEMVSLAYEAMLEEWADASDDQRIDLLTNVGWWATDIARSLVAGG